MVKKSVSLEEERKKALLVSVYKHGTDKSICEEHLQELKLLVDTYGVDTLHVEPCQIRKFDASTCIASGKVAALAEMAEKLNVDLIVFDDEISPGQQRNLEKLLKKPVIDRTEVILGVFAQRALTKEARLQVELAQVRYQAPRLKRLWTHLSRQAGTSGGGGGGAYLKGMGEKQIEVDRRLLKKEIEKLQNEIAEVKSIRQTQRTSRIKSEIPVFALVGYTNAGKSTLMNAMTDADVFVEDKLFATLDTTTRKFDLPNHQEVLLIDTVGFIRKLPHLLVAAFKSTLEEAVQADILMHMIDVSHPMAEEQAAATLDVLRELGAEKKPIITILNKVDSCKDRSMILRLKSHYTRTVEISALKKTGIHELQELMVEELNKRCRVVTLQIPQSAYVDVSIVMQNGHILHQDYLENDVIIKAELPLALANKYEKYLQK
jgi:GTP-binding protein HflX